MNMNTITREPDRVGAAARTRRILIETRAKTVQAERVVPWDPDGRGRAELQSFADSLPDCVVELRTDVADLVNLSGRASARDTHEAARTGPRRETWCADAGCAGSPARAVKAGGAWWTPFSSMVTRSS